MSVERMSLTRSIRAGAMIFVLGLGLSGCSGGDPGRSVDASSSTAAAADMASTPEAAEPAQAADAAIMVEDLADTRWRLVEFQSMSDEVGTLRPTDRDLYTMALNADGTVAMRLNCNRATGTWSAQASGSGTSGSFTFGPLATTRALCPPPSMDESIAAQSTYIRSYLLKDGNLYLSLMADGGIYAWEPDLAGLTANEIPKSPAEGGPRNWEVVDGGGTPTLRAQPSADAKSVLNYAPGTILDNLGCRRSEDKTWCDVQKLGGGARGFIEGDFLVPATSPNGTVETGTDDSALRAGQGDFDATGKIPCTQGAGQPMQQCDFAVARAGGGYATVVVERQDRSSRVFFFRMGIPIGVSSSEADPSGEFKASKEADLHRIQVGSERYEIPDAVVLGG